MAEFSSKRQRYGSETDSNHVEESNKRHKSSSSSYNHILSILDDEEEELDHHDQPIISDLSSLITTLQQELSSPPSATTAAAVEEEEEEELVVIRHLLEASDDELGIPSSTDGSDDHVEEEYDDQYGYGDDGFKIDGCDEYGLSVVCDGLWEFEDANANYYTLLHSQLFM